MASRTSKQYHKHRWQQMVLKLKRNSDGTVSRNQACLFAKCFKQCPSTDFTKTFNPVIKPSTTCVNQYIEVLEDGLLDNWA